MSRSSLTAIWSPEDARLAAELAAQHQTYPAHVAVVVDINTHEVIA